MAAEYLRPYVGSIEYINGFKRWILYLKGAKPSDLRNMSHIVRRMQKVKAFRAKSQRKSTLAIANYPDRFNVEVIPDRAFLVIPEVSSDATMCPSAGWSHQQSRATWCACC
jgi:restriction-modification enzyme MmeI-like protein